MSSPIRARIQSNIVSEQQTQLQSAAPANIKRRYAILFNEGPGYLLIDYLSEGAYSVTMLVQSLQDRQIYVRKLGTVQEYRDDLSEQCEDVRFAIDHSNVPRLMSSRYYEQIIPVPDRSNASGTSLRRYITPVTVWQFCNGGTINSIFQKWQEGHGSRIPEAVIWSFFASLLDSFMHIHLQGIIHRDTHSGNILLHWPDNVYVPELFLADFGMAQKYPRIADVNFSAPWTGSFDEYGNPTNHSLTQGEQLALGIWYGNTCADMKSAISILSSLIFEGRERQFLRLSGGNGQTAQTFLRSAAQTNSVVNGYSFTLIQAISAWSNILDTMWNQPLQRMDVLTYFSAQVQTQARFRINQFLSNAAGAHLSTMWMRPPPHQTRIAIWKDPEPILQPDPADRQSPSNIFQDHLAYHFNQLNPPFFVDTSTMTGHVTLRQGHFRVAELAYDFNTFEYRVVGIVDSLDEVPDLSPDETAPFDWDDPGNNARRYYFTDTVGSSIDDAPDTTPRQTHLAPHMVLGMQQPAPADSSSGHVDTPTPALPTVPIARRWTYINQNPAPTTPTGAQPSAALPGHLRQLWRRLSGSRRRCRRGGNQDSQTNNP